MRDLSPSTAPLLELAGRRVFVAGHRGMVGSALMRRLRREGCVLLTEERSTLDLRVQREVDAFFEACRPEVVFLAAAKVGGIVANDTRPFEFIHDNLLIETNVIGAAVRSGVDKLLFLGSSCIYPRLSPQPIPEEALLTGPLEETNQWYAVAKIAGIKLCDAARRQYGLDFISAMPTNLYGPGDTYDARSSHVIPALLMKARAALERGDRRLEIWGSGRPLREFMHVDDCADALVFLMKHWSGEGPINIGTGEEISIRDLAGLVMRVAGIEGDIAFDRSRPDGTPRKLVDTSRIRSLGWRPHIPLEEGLRGVWAELEGGRAVALSH